MQGYYWAETPEKTLFVVLMVSGQGYVPGVEGAIDLAKVFFLEPVQWPSQVEPPSQLSVPPKPGALAAGATRECVILPFAANG